MVILQIKSGLLFILLHKLIHILFLVFFMASDFLTVITGFKLFNDTLW